MSPMDVGSGPPDFSLAALDGRRVSLLDVARAKRGVVVVFWSGICSHCQRYDGYLNGFGTQHTEVALLAVASRQNEGLRDLEEIVARRGLRFALLFDGDRRVARQWQVEQTPRVFLIDSTGLLLYRGAIDNFKYSRDPEYEPYLEPAIADMMAGRPVRRRETPSFGCPIESIYYS